MMMTPQRDYMHLDTVLSSVGKHAFTLHGRLATEMEVCTVETYDENNNIGMHRKDRKKKCRN